MEHTLYAGERAAGRHMTLIQIGWRDQMGAVLTTPGGSSKLRPEVTAAAVAIAGRFVDGRRWGRV